MYEKAPLEQFEETFREHKVWESEFLTKEFARSNCTMNNEHIDSTLRIEKGALPGIIDDEFKIPNIFSSDYSDSVQLA